MVPGLIALALLLATILAFAIRRRRTAGPRRGGSVRGDDVRFSVYRPAAVAPGIWYDLLAFVHRTDRPVDTAADAPTPAQKVRAEAQRLLGSMAKAYESVAEDSARPVMRGARILFVPEIDGVEFNPPQAVVEWSEDMHRVLFQLRADARLDGTTVRGRLSVFAGPLLLAEMAIVLRVGAAEAAQAARDGVTDDVSPYRKVFASYSHRDSAIVRQMEAYALAFGDEYLRDVSSLRAGERWNPRIARLIEEADVFQLFWSWNALDSEFVREEWAHALRLGRENFVRPVYWQDPLPAAPERDLPPVELRALHFQRLPLVVSSKAAVPPPPAAARTQEAAPIDPDPTLAFPQVSPPPPPAQVPRADAFEDDVAPDDLRIEPMPGPVPTGKPASARVTPPAPPPSIEAVPRTRPSPADDRRLSRPLHLQWISAAALAVIAVTAVAIQIDLGGTGADPTSGVTQGTPPVLADSGTSSANPRTGTGTVEPVGDPPAGEAPVAVPASPPTRFHVTTADPALEARARRLREALGPDALASGPVSPASAIAAARAAGARFLALAAIEGPADAAFVSVVLIDVANGDTLRVERYPAAGDATLLAERIERAVRARTR